MKKFILTCLLTLSSAMAFAFSGSGTSSDPYLIKTADDLYSVRNYPSAYFKLANDIDLTEWIADNYPEAGWAPISSSASPFTGTFDGNGFTISGLYINRTTAYNGLFGYANGATVKNLNIICDITGANYTAAICGYGYSCTISDCNVEGEIHGKNYSGGFSGYGEIWSATDCTFIGNVKGGEYTGGIAGSASKLTMSRCAVEGNVSGSNQTGGLVGKILQTVGSSGGSYCYTRINSCYVAGNVTSDGSYVGGLFGYDDSSYSNQYSNSTSTNYWFSNTSSVNDCYYDGNVTANGDYVGGICGYATGQYIRCYAKGSVEGASHVGGIAGLLYGTYDSYSTYVTYSRAIIYSCITLCTKIKSTNGSNISRLCNTGSYCTLGTFGANTENKVTSDCQVYNGDTRLNVNDSQSQGYAIVGTALQRANTYTAINWNFTSTWNIDEGEGHPFLRFRQPSDGGTVSAKDEKATFNFTLPAELTPAVTPSDEEDSGVNITTKSFSNNDVTVSFGLGTRTQTFAARLWTNDDLSNCLRVYKDGTMTIATSSDNLITRIALTGDDTSSLTADVGTISGGIWTGEASSVTFTIGASYNKINTIDVTYKHDVLRLTDVAPAVKKGTYDPGKVKYSRVSGGDYASFCLPFDVALNEATGIEAVYMPMEQIIYNTETEWLMMFLEEQDMTSTIKAGTPFLAKTSDNEVTFSNSKRVSFAQPLSENPAAKPLKVFDFDGHSGVLYKNNTLGVTWGGTLVPTEATEGMNSFNINGSFGQHTGTLNAYRAYVMQTSSGASRVRGIQLNLAGDEGEVTSVFQLLNEPAASEGIYDMQGRRVLNAQQGGLYIINGKKVIK